MLARFVPLLLMMLGVGLILCAAAALLVAFSLARPPRMTDGRAAWLLRRLSPADLGLSFEDVRFDIRDERGRSLKIAGWWIPSVGSEGRCAVILHGYADAKVGSIAWAPAWNALGFNLLVLDLRAHGESGGTCCTAGYFERHDVAQVLDRLRTDHPQETTQLVLFGISLGAAVAAAAAVGRDDVAAIVLDSPYTDFRRAAMQHMDHLGLSPRLLQKTSLKLAEWITYADYAAVSPVTLIPKLRCPVLVIESRDDTFVNDNDRAALRSAVNSRPGASGPGEIWIAPACDHLMALQTDPEAYQRKIRTFLESASVIRRVAVV